MKNLLVTAISLLIFTAGCKETFNNYFINSAMDNLSKITSYEGVIVEKGMLRDKKIIKTRIAFSKKGYIYARVLEPASFKGDMILNNGNDIFMYYPRSRFGIRIRGVYSVIEDSYEKWEMRTRKKMERSSRINDISWDGSCKIAGRNAHVFSVTPQKAFPFRLKETFCSDIEFSFPLKLTLFRKNKSLFYEFQFENIIFNQEQMKINRDYSFPKNTMVAVWDFTSRGYSLPQIKSRLNFRLRVPKSLPEAMKLRKIIRAQGIIPTACLVYSDKLDYIILSEVKEYGIIRINPRGIRIPSISRTARLSFLGEMTTITWRVGNVNLTIIGTLPYYEMIDITKNIR